MRILKIFFIIGICALIYSSSKRNKKSEQTSSQIETIQMDSLYHLRAFKCKSWNHND